MKDRILLLGSKGLVGTAFEYCLNYHDVDYRTLSHRDFSISYPYPELYNWFKDYSPTIVINCAGIVGVNSCFSNATTAMEVNAIGVSKLVDLCIKHDTILVQISTHAVFDGKKGTYYIETDQPQPINVYGMSKYAGELEAQKYDKCYIFRFPTLFGVRRKGRVGFPTKLINDLIDNRDIIISKDKVDSPSYSMDVAAMALSIIKSRKSFGIYHIANEGRITYYDFFSLVAKYLGVAGIDRVTPVPESFFNYPELSPMDTSLSSDKISLLRPWDEALEDFLYGYLL